MAERRLGDGREQESMLSRRNISRGQEEKGTTEDEMTGWHHQLDGHESE